MSQANSNIGEQRSQAPPCSPPWYPGIPSALFPTLVWSIESYGQLLEAAKDHTRLPLYFFLLQAQGWKAYEVMPERVTFLLARP
ncbi:MAG TPA: hypothetical protein VNE38_12905 [Ktedonobacteraceae bacterium]|nr:hypothetical protein [Ktedonobacteraceae bacterium]